MISNKKDFTFKVILLGDVKVGKSEIMRRYIDNYFDNYYYNTYCK